MTLALLVYLKGLALLELCRFIKRWISLRNSLILVEAPLYIDRRSSRPVFAEENRKVINGALCLKEELS